MWLWGHFAGMPQRFFALETDHKTGQQRVHEVLLPNFSEPGFYRQMTSLSSFRGGRRLGASAQDRKHHRATPAWGPTKLYSFRPEVEWKLECKFFEGRGELEVVKHEGLSAFYAYINWDPSLRRYVDKNGQPIRFSILPKPGP